MNINNKMRELIDLIALKEDEQLDEGWIKTALVAALLAAGLKFAGDREIDHLMKTQPQLVELAKLRQLADKRGDVEKVKELDDRIENTLNFIRDEGRPVLDKHGNPVVPRYNKDN